MTQGMTEVAPHIYRIEGEPQPAGGFAIKAQNGWVSLEAIRAWAAEGRTREELASDCMGAPVEAIDAALAFALPQSSDPQPSAAELAIGDTRRAILADIGTLPIGRHWKAVDAHLRKFGAEREREALERAAKAGCQYCGARWTQFRGKPITGTLAWGKLWVHLHDGRDDDGVICERPEIQDMIRALVGSVDRAEAESK